MLLLAPGCRKGAHPPGPEIPTPEALQVVAVSVNESDAAQFHYVEGDKATIVVRFSKPVKPNQLNAAVTLAGSNSRVPDYTATLFDDDKSVRLQVSHLQYLTKYSLTIASGLEAKDGGRLPAAVIRHFATGLDSSYKFPMLTQDQLFNTVQQQTFKYFWDFAHPVSGLIREGSKHPANLVTSGGSGFGLMCLLVGIERGFISREEGLERTIKIVAFLLNTAQKFHGAFPHWLDGATGMAIAFSANDDGADLVETALLIQGLLCIRQYFDGTNATEVQLRNDINTIADGVEWSWFQKDGQQQLYWHWSVSNGWAMNLKIQGWNEALIVYVLAAASKNYSINKAVYDNGWAANGAMKNGQSYLGISLPLGPAYGGPLFFEHYSFLGIDPRGLSDGYANYETQTRNHTLINYHYCKANPSHYYGYSDSVWGLTASNIKGGYTASSPTNDQGFIAPTAALSSIPYTPNESIAALQFFYYVLGDKIFKEYGFTDAFSLDLEKHTAPWYDETYLAINQGPVIIMIENYRSGLLWNLFTSCPEIKAGMKKLGFSAPYL